MRTSCCCPHDTLNGTVAEGEHKLQHKDNLELKRIRVKFTSLYWPSLGSTKINRNIENQVDSNMVRYVLCSRNVRLRCGIWLESLWRRTKKLNVYCAETQTLESHEAERVLWEPLISAAFQTKGKYRLRNFLSALILSDYGPQAG